REKGQLAIGGRLLDVQVVLARDRRQQGRAALDVAGRPHADHTGVLALRLEAEVVVERCYAVGAAGRHVQTRGDVAHGRRVQEPEGFLRGVQRLDERVGLEALAAHRRVHDAPALVVARRLDSRELGLHARLPCVSPSVYTRSVARTVNAHAYPTRARRAAREPGARSRMGIW